MDLKEFANEVGNKLINDNEEFKVVEVRKNNGLVLTGISVKEKDKIVAPNVYLDRLYEQHLRGKTIEDIVKEVRELIEENSGNEFEQVASQFTDWNFVKENVVAVLVNAERNKELLKYIPYVPVFDLAIIYKVVIDKNNSGMSTITVKNEHMAPWGVNVEELHEVAYENTEKMMPTSIQSMSAVAKEMDFMDDELADILMDENLPAEQQMYVITNTNKVNGAIGMLYYEKLQKLAEKVGNDLYILPSSVHEVIAVSTDMGTSENFTQMVREINATQVSEEEQLADHVYIYDRDKRRIRIA